MESYSQRQAEFSKTHPAGTKVRISRAAHFGEDGWEGLWRSHMDIVGKEYKIKDYYGQSGVLLENGYVVPYFILEKVEENKSMKEWFQMIADPKIREDALKYSDFTETAHFKANSLKEAFTLFSWNSINLYGIHYRSQTFWNDLREKVKEGLDLTTYIHNPGTESSTDVYWVDLETCTKSEVNQFIDWYNGIHKKDYKGRSRYYLVSHEKGKGFASDRNPQNLFKAPVITFQLWKEKIRLVTRSEETAAKLRTIKEWFSLVADPDLRDKLLRRLRPKFGNLYVDKTPINLALAINNGFSWYDTPEGFDYWKDIERKAYRNQIPLLTDNNSSQSKTNQNGVNKDNTQGKAIQVSDTAPAVIRGKRPAGKTVSGSGGRTAIAVGSVSYKAVLGG